MNAAQLMALGWITLLTLSSPIALADSGGNMTYTYRQSLPCPAGQVGQNNWICKQGGPYPGEACNSKYGLRSPTDPVWGKYWSIESSTCVAAAYPVSTQTETQWLTCPATTPAGSINQTRTYEVWSDGSLRNYSGWTVNNACYAVYQSTQTETQWLTCPANTPSGSINQTRTYQVWSDGSLRNYSGFTVNNSCYNATPTVSNVAFSTDEDVTGNFSLSVSDDGPGGYTFQIVSAPANGTATISGNTLKFVPNPDWNGTTTLTYRVMDGAGAWSGIATVTITVRPVNDAPVAYAKTMVTDEDTTGTVTLSATDIDSPVPTVFQIVTTSPYGTASISGSSLSFAPNLNWNGITTVTYRAQDTAGAWSAPVTITITVNPVNDVPTLTGTTLTIKTKESTPITVRTAVSH
ncbi:tandem-95 repeat protein [Pseudomonas sp. PDM25]|uniref:tandem-95 repeat protein n=1 Tax=Pseudomonas sp. PDM25 TaxID=2854772 RepID=UPI001C486F67|nr:Ig-like domain-containing protein [Pseudomonas sp. PDM25]MBV7515660.1 tandem-95 repeat protein [Pseudomonas sp. PDM25]